MNYDHLFPSYKDFAEANLLKCSIGWMIHSVQIHERTLDNLMQVVGMALDSGGWFNAFDFLMFQSKTHSYDDIRRWYAAKPVSTYFERQYWTYNVFDDVGGRGTLWAEAAISALADIAAYDAANSARIENAWRRS